MPSFLLLAYRIDAGPVSLTSAMYGAAAGYSFAGGLTIGALARVQGDLPAIPVDRNATAGGVAAGYHHI